MRAPSPPVRGRRMRAPEGTLANSDSPPPPPPPGRAARNTGAEVVAVRGHRTRYRPRRRRVIDHDVALLEAVQRGDCEAANRANSAARAHLSLYLQYMLVTI